MSGFVAVSPALSCDFLAVHIHATHAQGLLRIKGDTSQTSHVSGLLLTYGDIATSHHQSWFWIFLKRAG